MAINVSNASSSAIYIYIATAINYGALQAKPFSWKLMAACHTQLQCYCNISYDVQFVVQFVALKFKYTITNITSTKTAKYDRDILQSERQTSYM